MTALPEPILELNCLWYYLHTRSASPVYVEPALGFISNADQSEGMAPEDEVRVWLVERTYSDDEQNIIILIYATPDGRRIYRMERALTSFTDERDTTAAVDVDPGNLSSVDDPELREQYATEVQRKQEEYSPTEAI